MLKKYGLDRLDTSADKTEAALQGLAQKIIEEFLRRPASALEVIEQDDSHGAGHTADASAAPEEP
jgi:hypothetical protein